MKKIITVLVIIIMHMGCIWGEENDPAKHVHGNYYLVFAADSTFLLLKNESNSVSGKIVFDKNIDSIALIKDSIYLLTSTKELYVVTPNSKPKADSITDRSKLLFAKAFDAYK